MVDDQRDEKGRAAAGNEIGVTHGAHSERKVSPRRQTALDNLGETAPWVQRPEFADAAEALADTQARAELVADWLDEHGLIDPYEEKPRWAVQTLIKLRRLEMDQRAALGLTPASYSKVARDLAAAERSRNVADLQAEGRQIIQARRNGRVTASTDDGDDDG